MNVRPSISKCMFFWSMFLLITTPSLLAQENTFRRSHPISLNSELTTTTPATGIVHVVGVMVQFQPDTNRFTSGSGIFGNDGFDGLPYLSNEDVTYIDPLPHNQNYFEAHLEFARNYFLKSSDNQLTLDYQVLPTVYQLDKPMEVYSPTGETFTLEKIAQLMHDVWAKVDEEGGFDATGLTPENTAFVIFHAGVGRDVELTGTSLDITPLDLPSIFLRDDDIAELLELSNFTGFELNNGSFRVTNSMLIPRTESRRGEDIAENEIVFPLSINGLLCASIGSYLGLPDLFNTENGQPAIGRFGLMDGAGFFAYNGLLPPEPSAWEKVYLGWETPFVVSPDENGTISLPAASLNQPNSIAKVELSSTEYFLIENRHRDPNLVDSVSAQVTITTRNPDTGTLSQTTFTNNDEDFIYQDSEFDTLLDRGTIVDVSNFDWSLPGGLDIGQDEKEGTADDRHLNGGILIWHIDEGIIAQGLLNGGVNGNELMRGVDLEEADGAQDIGRDPGLLDNTASFGFAYDYWWSDNNYRVISAGNTIDLNPDNVFGPNTYPNTESNSGAKSYFELYNFSDIGPVASFNIRSITPDVDVTNIISYQVYPTEFNTVISDFSLATQDDGYYEYFPLSLMVIENAADTSLIIPSQHGLFIYDHINPSTGRSHFIYETNLQQPIYSNFLLFGGNPVNTATAISISALNLDNFGIEYGVNIAKNAAFLSSQTGDIIESDFTGLGFNNTDGTPSGASNSFSSEIVNGKYVAIDGNTITFVGENIDNYTANFDVRLYAGTIQSNLQNLYYIFEDGTFTLVDLSKEDPHTVIFEEDKAEWPAIVDEGRIFRINKVENTLEGYNFNGALLNDMPVPAPDGFSFIGTPLIADITGDNIQDILVVAQNDYSVNIFAYETNGDTIEGFPLYVGGSNGAQVQPIHPVLYGDVLYALSHTGDLKAWKFLNFTSAQWPARYGANPYNKVSGDITFSEDSQTSFSVLNSVETYNWPNPADDETNIRFELETAGEVEITVIDFSGRIVFERKVQASGGAPEEISIETVNWSSGPYFARVKATVDGASESKIIKIGVAH